MPLGLGVCLALMVPRADNGCTGVTDVYQLTELINALCVYAFGPAILSRHFELLLSRPASSPAA